MEPFAIIQKYYAQDSDAYRILTTHSRSVADKALAIARRHPELNLDLAFIEEAALLHDIGVFRCDAPDIDCHGDAKLPVPHRDMRPVSWEEQIICFADKFYSKTHLEREKTPEKIRKSLSKYGEETVLQFDAWCKLFLGE